MVVKVAWEGKEGRGRRRPRAEGARRRGERKKKFMGLEGSGERERERERENNGREERSEVRWTEKGPGFVRAFVGGSLRRAALASIQHNVER